MIPIYYCTALVPDFFGTLLLSWQIGYLITLVPCYLRTWLPGIWLACYLATWVLDFYGILLPWFLTTLILEYLDIWLPWHLTTFEPFYPGTWQPPGAFWPAWLYLPASPLACSSPIYEWLQITNRRSYGADDSSLNKSLAYKTLDSVEDILVTSIIEKQLSAGSTFNWLTVQRSTSKTFSWKVAGSKSVWRILPLPAKQIINCFHWKISTQSNWSVQVQST